MSDLLRNKIPLTLAKEIFIYSFVSAFRKGITLHKKGEINFGISPLLRSAK